MTNYKDLTEKEIEQGRKDGFGYLIDLFEERNFWKNQIRDFGDFRTTNDRIKAYQEALKEVIKITENTKVQYREDTPKKIKIACVWATIDLKKQLIGKLKFWSELE
jgi:hypothetical protein